MMQGCSRGNRTRTVVRFVAVVTVVTTFHLQAIPSANAEDRLQNGPKARPVALPAVPQQAPRPAEGNQADQRWQTDRPANQNDPTASFVDSLKGNDAAIHLVVGQGRLLTTRRPIAREEGTAVLAVGDPTIIDFEVLPDPRMIRLIGKRAGVTDMSVTTTEGQVYNFEVQVGYDLHLLRAQLKQFFPDAVLKLGQIREHLVVEGQARSAAQVSEIVKTIQAYLSSVQVPHSVRGASQGAAPGGGPASAPRPQEGEAGGGNGGPYGGPGVATPEGGSRPSTQGSFAQPQVINLIRVPGVHQVLLRVQIAELNRTGMREIGTDIFIDGAPDVVLGSQIGGAFASLLGLDLGTSTTAFGIFSGGDFQMMVRALRSNSLLTILAEPNLVAMSGQEASFLAGGQFPVPVPQVSGGASNSITVEYKDFGVQLNFLPYVLDDGVIRLSVTPEVSSIDQSLGTTLIAGGEPIPGLTTRRAATTVEMREGQTLAIAGLLQVEIEGRTERIPGLGDLPYIGPLFSNTSHERVEKELLVLVTPELVGPMEAGEVPPLPGTEIMDPDDWEFYFRSQIEGRSGVSFPSTTSWDRCQRKLYELERTSVYGPVGFSESH